MNINYIEYSIGTQSLDIFFAGCNNHCTDCYNPDLMSFENGINHSQWFPKIKHYLSDNYGLIKRVFLVGGSPNHQDSKELEVFLYLLKKECEKYNILIYAFCGEEINEVQEVLKKYCDRIKTGAYIPSLKCNDNVQEGIKLATSNQKVLKKGIDF